MQLRDHGMINDETLRQLQQELDLERVRLDVVLHARPGT